MVNKDRVFCYEPRELARFSKFTLQVAIARADGLYNRVAVWVGHDGSMMPIQSLRLCFRRRSHKACHTPSMTNANEPDVRN